MVEFLTLFLGSIVTGHVDVELVVGREVAAVEIRLDDESLTWLRGAPWHFETDFGTELEPHLLQAIAYDRDERETDRARQWINLAPQTAEIGIVLDRDPQTDDVLARVSWQSITDRGEPSRVQALFNGEAFDIDNPQRIRLPPHDPQALNHLRIEMEFPDAIRSSAEVTFGGGYGETVHTELTPVAISLTGSKKGPSEEAMRAWFRSHDRPLTVHAAEKGPAEIFVVRDPAVLPLLQEMMARKRIESSAQLLRKNQRLRFVEPWSFEQPVRGEVIELFPMSAPVKVGNSGLIGSLAWVNPDEPAATIVRLADAVAVAGLIANQTGRRRAVVLVTTGTASDQSKLSPEQARRYLARVGVPLLVWNPLKGKEQAGAWGPATNIFPAERIGAAYSRLTRQLERQRVVWLNGLHLPQTITLDPAAEGIALVR